MNKIRQKRYKKNSDSKVKALHFVLINNQTKVYFLFGFMILFLILSYGFMMFSSVSYAYSLNDGKEQLSKLVAFNSSLKSQFLNKKDDIVEKNKEIRVAVGKINYIRVANTKLAYNK